MKKLFFFSRFVFFFPLQKLNEWMARELFRGKKTQKKPQKREKKKHNQLLLKKIGLHQNPNEWPMNFSREKKNIFFSRFAEEKKTRFSVLNGWMTNVHARGKNKIRYLWLLHFSIFSNYDIFFTFFSIIYQKTGQIAGDKKY